MAFRAISAAFGSRRVAGIAFGAGGVLMLLALLSRTEADPVPLLKTGLTPETANWLGPFGALLSEVLWQIGGLVAFGAPLVAFAAGRRRLFPSASETKDPAAVRLLILGSIAASATGLASLGERAIGATAGGFGWGGAVGSLLATALSGAMSPLGAAVVLTALGLIGFAALREWGLSEGSRPREQRRRALLRWLGKLVGSVKRRARRRAPGAPARRFVARIQRTARKRDRAETAPDASGEDEPAGKKQPTPRRERRQPSLLPGPEAAGGEAPGSWKLPSLQLLTRRNQRPAPSSKKLAERRKALEAACVEHGIRGRVDRIQPGPVVTTFEFRLGEGEKLKRLKSREEEICLALETPAIRVQRVRGTGVVGIEVPNETPEVVGLREILEAPAFREETGALPVAVGRLVDGEPLVRDLAEMPHLLIAGATGAGKSVQINTLLCSLLTRQTPDDLRLILIDPKRVELRPYRNLPHLLTPLILEPDRAKTVLLRACQELDRRTRVLEEHGVRNIAGYNRQVAEATGSGKRRSGADEPESPARMPRLVIVVDELADLFIHARAEVTPAIQRLLSLGRAEGIHLVLATQRPSTDIVSGTLKANLPTRIAFRVASYVDSRTILDRKGAEDLLGKGDMLMMRGGAELPRAQGAFVDEKEVGRLVKFWESAAAPVFDEAMLAEEEPSGSGLAAVPGRQGASSDRREDSLLPEARELIVREQKASTSMLQTEMGLGYQRARRIVAELERQGVVGPARGAQPREVLVEA